MTTNGKVRVPVKIEINIEEMIEKFREIISETIEEFSEREYYLDNEDNTINFDGEIESSCVMRYLPQTQWEPAEYDYEAKCGEFCGYEVEKSVENEISNRVKCLDISDFIKVSATFDEDFEFEEDDYEPDPDMMPGGWDWLKDHEGDESYESRGDWLRFDNDLR